MPSTPAAAIVWLDVPFTEKDAAKRAGARWDVTHRRWYAPQGTTKRLKEWVARADLPDVLPGEDRAFGGSELYVDMVPKSCWFTNVRSCVDTTDWDRIRRMVYARAGDCCETCGTRPNRAGKQWLEAHERWEYDEATSTQRLHRLIALCTPCHTATHFGFAQVRGLEDAARTQLAKVNGWTAADVALHIEGTVEVWYARDRRRWDLDLTMLTGAGVTITPPPDRDSRHARARD